VTKIIMWIAESGGDKRYSAVRMARDGCCDVVYKGLHKQFDHLHKLHFRFRS